MTEGSGFVVSAQGTCAIIHIDRGENRLNLEFIAGFNQALDKVERDKDIKSLTTIGVGKFYSNGIDLAWIAQQNEETSRKFLDKLNKLCIRLLEFPLPTIAALNGHCYAGGALIAFCHDYCVMQTNKGWLCFPEIHLRLIFRPSMFTFLRARIKDAKVLSEAILFGKKYTAEEALRAGLVHKISSSDHLLSTAVSLAMESSGSEGLDRDTLQGLKRGLYADVINHMKSEETDDSPQNKTVGNKFKKAKL